MTDRVVGALVVVVAAGSFLAGWMARHAQALAHKEQAHWQRLDAHPVAYDWAADDVIDIPITEEPAD